MKDEILRKHSDFLSKVTVNYEKKGQIYKENCLDEFLIPRIQIFKVFFEIK